MELSPYAGKPAEPWMLTDIPRLEEPAVPPDLFHRDSFIKQHIQSNPQRTERGEEVGTHEVGECERCAATTHEERTPVGESGEMLPKRSRTRVDRPRPNRR